METEVKTIKVCSHCESECDIENRFCAKCGSEFEVETKISFGKGKPLKYFNFLFNFGIFYTLILGINQIKDVYSNFSTLFNYDFIMYFSYITNYYHVLFMILNFWIVFLLFKTKYSNNKLGFAKIYIYRLLLLAIDPIIALIVVFMDFGASNIDINRYIFIFVGQGIASIIAYIYFIKRIDFKWFDFSNIL